MLVPPAASAVTKPSDGPPGAVVRYAPPVVGKFAEVVVPPTKATPPRTAIDAPLSLPAPPRNVEELTAPAGVVCTTKASRPAAFAGCTTPAVVGKPGESVHPATDAAPPAA